MNITQSSLVIVGANTPDRKVFWNGQEVSGISELNVSNDAERQRVVITVAEDPLLAEMKAASKDLDAHNKALAGRPDNGRYSRETSTDIVERHGKKIIDTAYSDYQNGRKKYVEETVNPKKRFKFGRLK